MKVYIVWLNSFYGDQDMVAVFSSREKAQAYISGRSKGPRADGPHMEIEEYEVDKS